MLAVLGSVDSSARAATTGTQLQVSPLQFHDVCLSPTLASADAKKEPTLLVGLVATATLAGGLVPALTGPSRV